MSAQICVLASGSKGNCTYITDGTTRLLIDAGLSCRRTEQELAKLGTSIADINAILLTHEHIDHTYGLVTIERKFQIPVLANRSTAASVDVKLTTNITRFCKDNFDTGFNIGNIDVLPFRIMHDAVCPVGYTLTVGGHRVSYVTDLGSVTDSVRQNVLGSELVILESNHDLEMLATGTYPPELQARIRGKNGHLSNEQSAALAVELARGGTRLFVLAHLSEENNTPSLALRTSRTALAEAGLADKVRWIVAGQNAATEVITL